MRGTSENSAPRKYRDEIARRITARYFEQKIGFDPPERALVLCCDEKSHARLWSGAGWRESTKMTTSETLFAALNYLDGKLITRTEQRHTHVEWLRLGAGDTQRSWTFT